MTIEILSLLDSGSYQTYNRDLARLFGSINAAVMLSELVNRYRYHRDREELITDSKHEGLWFYYTIEKCEERTILSRKEQDTAIKILEKFNVAKKATIGIPGKRHFCLNLDGIEELLSVSKKHSRMTETDKQGSAKRATSNVPNGQPHIYKELNKEPHKENIAQTAEAASQEDDFHFSKDSKKFENITQLDLNDWSIAYPYIDIRRQIAAAEQWLRSNKSRANKKLWRKFLTGWLSRANDREENRKAYQSQTAQGSDRRTKNIDGTPINSPVDGLF